MPRTIPRDVPKTFDVLGDSYGVKGATAALQNAKEADRLATMYGSRHAKAPSDSLTEVHYRERRDYYIAASIEWRACALNTLLWGRKKLHQDEAEQLKLEHGARELVCSPESIQDAMKEGVMITLWIIVAIWFGVVVFASIGLGFMIALDVWRGTPIRDSIVMDDPTDAWAHEHYRAYFTTPNPPKFTLIKGGRE